MSKLLDRLPRISGHLYTGPDAEVVEKIWDGITFLNDDGKFVDMTLYLDEDDELQVIESNLWDGTYVKDSGPTEELNFYKED